MTIATPYGVIDAMIQPIKNVSRKHVGVSTGAPDSTMDYEIHYVPAANIGTLELHRIPNQLDVCFINFGNKRAMITTQEQIILNYLKYAAEQYDTSPFAFACSFNQPTDTQNKIQFYGFDGRMLHELGKTLDELNIRHFLATAGQKPVIQIPILTEIQEKQYQRLPDEGMTFQPDIRLGLDKTETNEILFTASIMFTSDNASRRCWFELLPVIFNNLFATFKFCNDRDISTEYGMKRELGGVYKITLKINMPKNNYPVSLLVHFASTLDVSVFGNRYFDSGPVKEAMIRYEKAYGYSGVVVESSSTIET